MRTTFALIVTALLFIGQPSWGQDATPDESSAPKPDYVMCKNKDVVRTIRIEKNGNACKALYTKDGTDSVVGRSKTEDICREVFEKIKSNLEKANWKCKDITQARVSSSNIEP